MLGNGAVRFHIPIDQYLIDQEKATDVSMNRLVLVNYETRTGLDAADQGKSTLSDIRLYESDEVRTVTDYDAAGNVESVRTASDPRNITTRYEHDGIGRQTRRILDAGGLLERNYTTFFDPAGNVLIERNDAADTQTQHYYDRLDRLVATILPDPDGNAATPNGLITVFTYDAAGNLIRQTNGEGETTYTDYDAQGRAIVEIDGNGDQTHYRYDGEGNLLSIIDAEGNITSYTYDGLNRVKTETNAFGTRTYVYNAAGNLFRLWDRNGKRREFYYDALDRRIEERWQAGTPSPIERVLRWEYDKLGRVTSEVIGSWTTTANDVVNTYQYDGLGRMVAQANYDPADLTHGTNVGLPKVRQTYDFAFEYATGSFQERMFRNQYESDVRVAKTQFQYDRLARLIDTDDFDPEPSLGPAPERKHLNFAYDTAGNLDAITHFANFNGAAWQNTFVSDLAYDKAARLTSITHDLATDIVHAYAYDNASRVTDFNTTNGSTPTITRGYIYDDAGQLTDVTGGFHLEFYEYDDNGNRVLRGSYNYTSPIHSIGLGNRLMDDGSYLYDYDGEGNLTKRTLKSNTAITTEYVWDHRNRLTTVTEKNGATVTSQVNYTYDAQGRRVKRAYDANGGTPNFTNEFFVYNGDELAMRFGNTAGLTHRYMYGPLTDHVLVDEVFNSAGQSTETLWLLADHQGTVRDIVDDNGTLRKHIEYDSFGQITDEVFYDVSGEQVNPAIPEEGIEQLFYFQGRPWDAEGEHYDFRARPYDPRTGRFWSNDPEPVTSGGDINPYRAFENDPNNNRDPSGRSVVKPTSYLPALASPQSNPFSTISYATSSYNVPTVDQSISRLNTAIGTFDYYRNIQSVASGRDFTRDVFKLADLGANVATFPTTDSNDVTLIRAGRGNDTYYFDPVTGFRDNRTYQTFVGTGGTSYQLFARPGQRIITPEEPTTAHYADAAFTSVNVANLGRTLIREGARQAARETAFYVAEETLQRTTGLPIPLPATPRSFGRFADDYSVQPRDTYRLPIVDNGPFYPNFPRSPRDVVVDPTPARAKDLGRPIGLNAVQNAELRRDILSAERMGARNILVNQQQVNAKGIRVGVNIPDLQFTLRNGQRVYVEYDTPSSPRALPHLKRIQANDPIGKVILKTIPSAD